MLVKNLRIPKPDSHTLDTIALKDVLLGSRQEGRDTCFPGLAHAAGILKQKISHDVI